MTDFELIDNPSTEAVIKVVGVGGCGCNAIDHMLSKGIEGVDLLLLILTLKHFREIKHELKFN